MGSFESAKTVIIEIRSCYFLKTILRYRKIYNKIYDDFAFLISKKSNGGVAPFLFSTNFEKYLYFISIYAYFIGIILITLKKYILVPRISNFRNSIYSNTSKAFWIKFYPQPQLLAFPMATCSQTRTVVFKKIIATAPLQKKGLPTVVNG